MRVAARVAVRVAMRVAVHIEGRIEVRVAVRVAMAPKRLFPDLSTNPMRCAFSHRSLCPHESCLTYE